MAFGKTTKKTVAKKVIAKEIPKPPPVKAPQAPERKEPEVQIAYTSQRIAVTFKNVTRIFGIVDKGNKSVIEEIK